MSDKDHSSPEDHPVLRTPSPQNNPNPPIEEEEDTDFPLSFYQFSSDEEDDPDFPLEVVQALHFESDDSSTEEEEDSSNQEEEEEEEAAVMAQPAVSGGQLSSVTVYSGNQGLDGLVYAEAIDRAKEQFGWTQVQTARAAVTRGGNAVANWVRGEKAAGINYTGWNEDIPNPNPNNLTNLRPAFLTRFGPKYTTGGAVAAISDLKQRTGETVGGFLDRVKIAVDMLHYNVPEDQRNAAFRASYTRLVIAQFGSGISDDIREQVFGVAVPPNTIAGVLTAATAIENEKHSKATKLVINNIENEKKETPESESIEQKCEKLEKQMKEVLMINKRGGRGNRPNNPNIQCYQCGGRGHIRSQCRGGSNQRPRGRGNGFGGRGRGRGFPVQTRRGQFRSNFGANRGRPNYSNQFPIGDLTDQWDQEVQDWQYDDYYGDWDPNAYDTPVSGNDPWGRY